MNSGILWDLKKLYYSNFSKSRWNLQDPKLQIPYSVEKKDPEFYVFKMIDGLHTGQSTASQIQRETQLERLEKLKQLSERFDLSSLAEVEFCPVCPSQLMLLTPRDVWHHLQSDQHTSSQAKLLQE